MRTIATVMTAPMPAVGIKGNFHFRGLTPLIAELNEHDPRAKPGQKNARLQQVYSRTRDANRQSSKVHFVPLVAQANAAAGKMNDKDASFGQRLVSRKLSKPSTESPSTMRFSAGGGIEMSFIPSGTGDDDLEPKAAPKKKGVRKGVEVFGAGMERGVEEPKGEMGENERSGRKQRRKGMRRGSKNVFRQLSS